MAESDTLAALQAQAEPLQATLHGMAGLADSFGRAMSTAFKDAVVDGERLEDVLKSLALSLAGKALSASLAPVGQGLIDGISGLFSAARPGAAGGAPALPMAAASGSMVVTRIAHTKIGVPDASAPPVQGTAKPESRRGALAGRMTISAGFSPFVPGASQALPDVPSRLAGSVIAAGSAPLAGGASLAAPSYFPAAGALRSLGQSALRIPQAPERTSDGGRAASKEGAGGAPIHVNFSVTARDADSFRRSEAELSAMLARVVARGRRGL